MNELRIDFEYDTNDDLPLALLHRDNPFLIRRSAKITVDAATRGASATLVEIGSGVGDHPASRSPAGLAAVGLEPSVRMLHAARGNLGREAGRRRIVDHFSWRETALRTQALYEEVLSERAGR